jgi:putative MATE family efflux protein
VNRTAILEGPIAPTLLGLAGPVLVVLAVQTLVGVAETWFVSFLGTSAIAGVALVFPLFMLMTMMSNGGMGGGVSSAIARAVGAGRTQDADALTWHALVIAIACGALFTAGAWIGGPRLYRALGAEGETLRNALAYSNLVFAAAIPAWIANLLASALRGAGNVRVPAIVTSIGALATLVLSPLLVLGWGVIPGQGVAGAGYAMIAFNVAAALALALFLRLDASPVRLRRVRLERRLFSQILRVGLPSAAGTIVSNLTVVVTTAFVGPFGRDAIAGYGLASRLDYLLIPLLFALGTAAVTMVGTNVGAGHHARARHIAWTAAAISSAAVACIGFAAAAFPHGWIGLFSHEPEVLRVGAAYLRRVAPFYPFVGLGMALYFASQGAGRMAWPFSASVGRLAAVVAFGGWWVGPHHGSLVGVFWIVAAAQVLFGLVNAIGMAWSGRSVPAEIQRVQTRPRAEGSQRPECAASQISPGATTAVTTEMR